MSRLDLHRKYYQLARLSLSHIALITMRNCVILFRETIDKALESIIRLHKRKLSTELSGLQQSASQRNCEKSYNRR